MSWDVSLNDKDGNPVNVVRFQEGGTQPVGGTCEADLNITYNYSKLFRENLHPDGLVWLHGKKAKKTIRRLERAIKILGTEIDDDYWKATPGNAGYALSFLWAWAKMYPNATWKVN